MRPMTMLGGWFVWKGLRVEKSQRALPPKIRAWVEARKRHRLSHEQVQMARGEVAGPEPLERSRNDGLKRDDRHDATPRERTLH